VAQVQAEPAVRGDVADSASLGPFCVIGEGARVGARSRLGAHVVVHPGTTVGEDCEVQDGAVLGKPPKLARRSAASRAPVQQLVLEDGAVICCQAIVFAGARIGAGAIIGDQAYVRERSVIGAGSVIGRGSTVENDVAVGERVRVQTDAYLTAHSTIEDDVFVGPGVLTTNDSTMSRHDDRYPVLGAVLRRACRLGGGAVLVPGIEIGEEAFIAAGAVVTHDVPARGVVMGVPGRVVREVPEADLLEHWR
jgi:UDP-3-O-[3-hydroxymyristoyl] glucosamine N-acyltransferase